MLHFKKLRHPKSNYCYWPLCCVHTGRDGPSSNAEASFNAWFPIMFGVFPNGAGGQSGNAAGRGTQNQGQGQDQGNSYGGSNGFERSSAGTTVIANSVSNGRNGVATSHAIAYGNPRSSQKWKREMRNDTLFEKNKINNNNNNNKYNDNILV